MIRKEDKEAIMRAFTIISMECDKHKRCKDCPLYKDYDCILEKPPACIEPLEIIKCFT